MKKLNLLLSVILISAVVNIAKAQVNCAGWAQKANYSLSLYSAVGFSIGTKGYIGTGETSGFSGAKKTDFWEYDPSSNIWTQKADFGAGSTSERARAVGFSIGAKGYIAMGEEDFPGRQKDIWEYNSTGNTWTQKADLAFTSGRQQAVGFSIGTKAYIGTGEMMTGPQTDFWEFDPGSNTWTQKADFGGGNREDAVGFSIAAKGYIGTGWNGTSNTKDFWEYDPGSNTWTQKTDFGGTARRRSVGFSIGAKGYIATGWDATSYTKDFWEYDPGSDTWTQKPDVGGNGRQKAVGFSIGTKGYIGTGSDGSLLGDFWEYSEYVMSNNNTSTGTNCLSSCDGSATAIPSGGVSPYTYSWSSGGGSGSTASNLCAGTHTVTVIDATGCSITTNIVVGNLNSFPTANAGPDVIICPGGPSTTLSASGGTNYTWSPTTGLSNANISNPVASPTTTTTYTVAVTDANGCSNTDTVVVTMSPGATANAGSDAVICLGGNTTLSASGGVNYSWSPTTGLSNPNISNPAASPVASTTYTVTVTDANGCGNSDIVDVTVYSVPNVTFSGLATSYCIDNLAVTLTGSPAGGTFSGTGISGNQFNPAVASVGTYSITYSYTDGNNCTNTSSQNVTVNNCTKIESIDFINSLNIYPNPNTGKFNIEMNIVQTEKLRLEITNRLGQVIFTEELKQVSGKYEKQLDLREHPAGVYNVKISSDDETINKQIIIK